jgi:hypothetical protein
MSHTVNRFTMDTPNPDGQLFIGSTKFADIGTHTAIAYPSAGLLERTIAASNAAVLVADLMQMIRTGVLATPNSTQRQFGTAASQPGPSSVAGTSGPFNISGFPPFTSAQLPTLGGKGNVIGKGIQVNWVDLIYSVAAVNLSAATVGLTSTVFQNGVAPAVTNIIALGANGLPVAITTQPGRTRVTVVSPVMTTADGTELILNVNLTTPAGGTAIFYGAIVGLSFNFN